MKTVIIRTDQMYQKAYAIYMGEISQPVIPEGSTMVPHAPGFIPECPIDSESNR